VLLVKTGRAKTIEEARIMAAQLIEQQGTGYRQ
jgi:hypothetical protein